MNDMLARMDDPAYGAYWLAINSREVYDCRSGVWEDELRAEQVGNVVELAAWETSLNTGVAERQLGSFTRDAEAILNDEKSTPDQRHVAQQLLDYIDAMQEAFGPWSALAGCWDRSGQPSNDLSWVARQNAQKEQFLKRADGEGAGARMWNTAVQKLGAKSANPKTWSDLRDYALAHHLDVWRVRDNDRGQIFLSDRETEVPTPSDDSGDLAEG